MTDDAPAPSEINAPPVIVLIGPRASGKSTVAIGLARALGREAIDLDPLILERLGDESVTQAWERAGEAGWREAEAAVALELLSPESRGPETERILAFGGGTPVIKSVRAELLAGRKRGDWLVVLLEATPATLAARLRSEPGDRPSLLGDDAAALGEIEAILRRRQTIYSSCADITIDVDSHSEADVVAAIVEELKKRG